MAPKALTLNIQNRLFVRIKKHLNALKHLEVEEHTLQDWILTAIKENLEEEIKEDSLSSRQIKIFIDSQLSERIIKRVEFMKKFRRHYSKTQLVLECIFVKLEKEEVKTQEAFQKLMQQTN